LLGVGWALSTRSVGSAVIEYNPLPTTSRFHESRARVKVLWGPIGTGKTSAALWEYVLTCMESPIPLDGMAIRGSYRELRDSTLKTFLKWFAEIVTWRESDSMALIQLPSVDDPGVTLEHILRFRSLEKPEDTRKVMSFEGAFFLLDEVAPTFAGSTMKASAGIPVEIAEYTNARLRHEYQGRHAHRYTQVIVANPPQPSHWLYKSFIAKDPDELRARKGGVEVFFVPNIENRANLPPDYYEILSDTFHDPDVVRRLINGEIVPTYSGVSVFPEAKSAVHFTSARLKPIPGVPLELGWDYGLTPGTLFTQIAPSGQWRIMTEVQNFNLAFEYHLDQVVKHLNDLYPGFELHHWGDPAGSQRTGVAKADDPNTFVRMAAQKCGFRIQAGKVDWQSRKEAMKQRLLRLDSLGAPGLLVSRSGAPLFAEGLSGGYRYPQAASGQVGDRPIKNHLSHLQDCAQYIASRVFQITMKQPRAAQEPPPLVARPPDPFRNPWKPPSSSRGGWLAS
jgi:hypothetical protein